MKIWPQFSLHFGLSLCLPLLLGVAVGTGGGSSRWIDLRSQAVRAQEEDAIAPDIAPDTVELFARVLLEIEPFRLKALEETNNTADTTAQNEIRRQFIRDATAVIESHNLSVPDYNRLTIQLREDPELKAQIEQAIRSIQLEEISRSQPF
ncbi:DUF4168 domain-containing protein [Synechococcus sp. PCC 7336]|uniref:DUF4168 domain-containing protein n=1 Tax=Synechococcus sp. PCC 7336 TaxID=195250 RepID=UPI00034B4AEC|nr:DUF4168 domain-containing protein [Synechococcus sp. PCC 7336]